MLPRKVLMAHSAHVSVAAGRSWSLRMLFPLPKKAVREDERASAGQAVLYPSHEAGLVSIFVDVILYSVHDRGCLETDQSFNFLP